MTCEEICRREIVELHAFFQQWFRGELPDTDVAFARFAETLAPEFEIVTPAGVVVQRDDCLAAVRSGHASDPDMTIEIRNYKHRVTHAGMSIVGYEEWQMRSGTASAWRSTAVFITDTTAPQNVRWVQVHETYLPGKDGRS